MVLSKSTNFHHKLWPAISECPFAFDEPVSCRETLFRVGRLLFGQSRWIAQCRFIGRLSYLWQSISIVSRSCKRFGFSSRLPAELQPFSDAWNQILLSPVRESGLEPKVRIADCNILCINLKRKVVLADPIASGHFIFFTFAKTKRVNECVLAGLQEDLHIWMRPLMSCLSLYKSFLDWLLLFWIFRSKNIFQF